MAFFVFHKIYIIRGNRRQIPPDKQDLILIQHILTEIVLKEVILARGVLNKSSSDKSLVSFLLKNDLEEYLLKFNKIILELLNSEQNFTIDHITLILESENEPSNKLFLNDLKKLSELSKTYSGFLLVGKCDLHYFKPKGVYKENGHSPLLEVEIVTHKEKPKKSFKKYLLLGAFSIFILGSFLGATKYYLPKIFAYIRNEEAKSLLNSLDTLEADILFLRIKNLKIARYSQDLETILVDYTKKSFKLYLDLNNFNSVKYLENLSFLLKNYPSSQTLSFQLNLFRLNQDNEAKDFINNYQKYGANKVSNLLITLDYLNKINFQNDPYSLIFLIKDFYLKGEAKEKLALHFSKILISLFNFNLSGRKAYILELIQLMPENLISNTFKLGLSSQDARVFKVALELYLGANLGTGTKLREIFKKRFLNDLLVGEELQALFVLTELSGKEFLIDYLSEILNTLKRKEQKLELHVYLEQAINYLKTL